MYMLYTYVYIYIYNACMQYIYIYIYIHTPAPGVSEASPRNLGNQPPESPRRSARERFGEGQMGRRYYYF